MNTMKRQVILSPQIWFTLYLPISRHKITWLNGCENFYCVCVFWQFEKLVEEKNAFDTWREEQIALLEFEKQQFESQKKGVAEIVQSQAGKCCNFLFLFLSFSFSFWFSFSFSLSLSLSLSLSDVLIFLRTSSS
jgi:hypothetical protein